MFSNIPAEMRAFQQWVLWRLEWKRGDAARELKPTKIPYALSGSKASVTNPATWGGFESVCAADIRNHAEPCDPDAPISETGYSGIGFVFTRNDPFCGADLDDTHGDNEAFERQKKIFEKFSTYSEFSPSMRGLHLILKAKLPGPGRRRASVELYDSERFFTMTGKTYFGAPIEERQELAELLYSQMGGPVVDYIYGQDQEQKESDETIHARAASAVNGEKYSKLFAGDWGGFGYPSQSEADFALVDIIAFYTQNRKQIDRLYSASVLGKTPKDNYAHRCDRKAYVNYMIEKSFDRQLPPIDIEGLTIAFEKAQAERKAAREAVGAAGKPSGKPAAPYEAPASTAPASAFAEQALVRSPAPSTACEFPPGLVGEIAQFIYDAAPRPVRQIALAGALGFMAGVTGRAYGVSGAGLNIYLMLIAKTGSGKEAIANGLNMLLDHTSKHVPGVLDFRGPVEIASPQALTKWLVRAPCCYALIGEVGLKLKEMSSSRAGPNVSGLRRTLLDVFGKSSKGNALGSMAYSDGEKNTAVVSTPAFTLIGESTPEKLYENLSEDVITDGLMPRFIVIEYTGPRVAKNKKASSVEPSISLLERFGSLAAQCVKFNATGTRQTVPTSTEAQEIFDQFDKHCDAQLNDNSLRDGIRQLWNRGDLNAMKLAALFAVGENYVNPVISADNAMRACNMIYAQVTALKARFDNDEIGGGSVDEAGNEAKQIEFMVRVIGQWACNSWTDYAKKYRVTEEMHRAKVFPYNSLHMRLIGQTCFKFDRRGASVAIEKTFRQLLDADDLREVPKAQMKTEHGKSCRAFAIANADRFIDAA